jgi:hypothetical protein
MKSLHDGQIADTQAVRAGVPFVSFAPSQGPENPTVNGTTAPARGVDDGPTDSAALSGDAVTHSDLASWLLAKEIGVEADSADLSVAAERVCQKLSRPLSRSISSAGFQAILSRALHLARAEFPFLEGVRAGRGADAGFEGLIEHVHDVEPGVAVEGLVAVLGTLLDLLIRFIGEVLTLRMVREVWPDLPSREPSQAGNSDGREARLSTTYSNASRKLQLACLSTSCQRACRGWTRCLAEGFPNTAST